MNSLPALGLVLGTRPGTCLACGSCVVEVAVQYVTRDFLGIRIKSLAWQKQEHRCVPIAADGCADPYCDDEAHAGGGA